jgi:hypothetical protein
VRTSSDVSGATTPESPLLVAVTAILTRCVRVSILWNGYEHVYTRAPELPRRAALSARSCWPARLTATRNDFGTVRAYGCLVPVGFVMKCAES